MLRKPLKYNTNIYIYGNEYKLPPSAQVLVYVISENNWWTNTLRYF